MAQQPLAPEDPSGENRPSRFNLTRRKLRQAPTL
jgi:hypothetical protein